MRMRMRMGTMADDDLIQLGNQRPISSPFRCPPPFPRPLCAIDAKLIRKSCEEMGKRGGGEGEGATTRGESVPCAAANSSHLVVSMRQCRGEGSEKTVGWWLLVGVCSMGRKGGKGREVVVGGGAGVAQLPLPPPPHASPPSPPLIPPHCSVFPPPSLQKPCHRPPPHLRPLPLRPYLFGSSGWCFGPRPWSGPSISPPNPCPTSPNPPPLPSLTS